MARKRPRAQNGSRRLWRAEGPARPRPHVQTRGSLSSSEARAHQRQRGTSYDVRKAKYGKHGRRKLATINAGARAGARQARGGLCPQRASAGSRAGGRPRGAGKTVALCVTLEHVSSHLRFSRPVGVLRIREQRRATMSFMLATLSTCRLTASPRKCCAHHHDTQGSGSMSESE